MCPFARHLEKIWKLWRVWYIQKSFLLMWRTQHTQLNYQTLINGEHKVRIQAASFGQLWLCAHYKHLKVLFSLLKTRGYFALWQLWADTEEMSGPWKAFSQYRWHLLSMMCPFCFCLFHKHVPGEVQNKWPVLPLTQPSTAFKQMLGQMPVAHTHSFLAALCRFAHPLGNSWDPSDRTGLMSIWKDKRNSVKGRLFPTDTWIFYCPETTIFMLIVTKAVQMKFSSVPKCYLFWHSYVFIN